MPFCEFRHHQNKDVELIERTALTSHFIGDSLITTTQSSVDWDASTVTSWRETGTNTLAGGSSTM